MGAGKTAVGRRLARDLSLEFFDCDEEIQHRTGVDIGFIFDKEGEEGFRRREKEMLAELTARSGVVVATGGGAVVNPDNRRLLSQRGTVVYLKTSVDQQAARVRQGRGRPMLRNQDPKEALQRLYQVREPLYGEVADLVVTTDQRKVPALTTEILSALKKLDETP